MDAENEPTSEKDTEEEPIILRNKRKVDSKAYAKLYRSFNSKSVSNITIKPEVPPKPRPESLQANLDELKAKYSPASFGYPKQEKKEEPKSQQDENCNVIEEEGGDSDCEYRIIVRQQAKSRESIDKIAQELDYFTMDRKERKRTSSFKKLFTGGFFGKDKKKKEDEKNKRAQNDNLQNESYNRQIQNQNESYNKQNQNQSYNESYHRQNQSQGPNESYNRSNYQSQNQYQQPQNDSFIRHDSYRKSHESYQKTENMQQPPDEGKLKELEQNYADMHISRFNQIRKSFTKSQDYVPMEPKPKKSISDYLSVQKYIDTSSSTSTSETTDKPPKEFRQTPPRADEINYQNFKVVKPKATHVVAPFKNETLEKPQIAPRTIRNETSLENHNQEKPNEITEPRTIERNLDKNHSDKDTYGTVFDSLEYLSRNGEMKPVNQSPKSLEGSKLRLPSNREIVTLQPRVKSPIPSSRISTEKLIATELLRNSRSPTPPRKPKQEEIEANFDGVLKGKPPISPKVILNEPRQEKPKVPERTVSQTDRITSRIDSSSSINNQQIYNNTNGIYGTNRSNTSSVRVANNLYNKNPDERYGSFGQQEQNRQYGSSIFTFDEIPRTNSEIYGYANKSNDGGSTEIYGNKNDHGLNNKDIYVTRADLYRTTTANQDRPKPDTITTNVMVHVPSPTKPPSMMDLRRSSTPVSPQKEDIRKSVEAYYWKELKKMKEKEDYELYMMQMQIEETARLRRSRSLSPNARIGRRSLSLPREIKAINEPPMQQDVYARIQRQQFQPQAIPEGKPLYFDNSKVRRTLTYEQNFVRNTPERNTFGGTSREGYYRPIFRRGSLTKQEMINQNLNKKVSFNAQQNWPTKNGYTVSPPQRRIDSLKSVVDDEVFIPEPVYQYYPIRQQYYPHEVEYAYHPQVYSSRQSLAELPQPTKQINVHNKICDIYGQIHDSPSIQKSGVIMGQLQRSPQTPRHNYNPNFVRGTRLTASANDMQRFYPVRANYGPPARPLPPVPRKNAPRMSDTESGSDAGEVQRIMSRSKKKSGFFGK